MITQELFDESVLENQECFDLSPEDAVTETVDQLLKQQQQHSPTSYTLDHIFTSHPESIQGEHDRKDCRIFVESLEFLDSVIPVNGKLELLEDNNDQNDTVLQIICHLKLLQKLSTTLDNNSQINGSSKLSLDVIEEDREQQALQHDNLGDDTEDAPEQVIRTNPPKENSQLQRCPIFRNLLLTNNGMFTLMTLLGAVNRDGTISVDIVESTLTCLITLLQQLPVHANPDAVTQTLRDSFVAWERVVTLMDLANGTPTLLIKLYVLARLACQGCERNKVQFVQSRSLGPIDGEFKSNTGVKVLIHNMQSMAQNETDIQRRANTEACRLILSLCRYDDSRAQVSSAHDHAMEFFRSGVVQVLSRILVNSLDEQYLELSAACMSAVRVTCVNDDIIQHWVAAGLLKTIQEALSYCTIQNEDEKLSLDKLCLLSNTLGVIRNVCGNDEIKTTLCTDGRTIPFVVQNGFQQHRAVASIQEHACGIVAAMALRSPSNARLMVETYGVAKEIVLAMTRLPNHAKVQRQGALAIRNIVARAPESKDTFLDLGVEHLLRTITGALQGSVEEAYAALRDLGCTATMVTYDVSQQQTITRGTALGRRVQMFGDVKSKFRATFEPSTDDMDARISQHAAVNHS